MFDQCKNQVKSKCSKCKKLHPDTGLYEIWNTKKEKVKIIKQKCCAKCFNTEKEKFLNS